MSNKQNRYNFYEESLWTGRLTSFTESINANLRLLRVILLTKGSTIMEFSKLLGQGLLKVNDSMGGYKLPENFKKHVKSLDGVQDAVIDILPNLLGSFGGGKPKDEDDLLGLVKFKFEETQLYNLRTLSLNQKTFVNNRLRQCVTAVLQKINNNDNNALDEIALIRKSFQNIAADIEIVQRAIVQRVHEINDDGKYVPSMQASALQITDMLALLALRPFQHLLPTKSDITPITFFSQETHIQSLPYGDNVVLIGIRYDQVLQNLEDDKTPPPFELLAIPHEIGHYIYQRADLKDQRTLLQKIVTKEFGLAKWLAPSGEEGLNFKDVSAALPIDARHRQWCEEIFADICGCIVAGPLAALSLLSILVSRADDKNRSSDGEHPTGILRPFILKEILVALNQQQPQRYPFNAAAEDMIAVWQDIARKFGYKTDAQTEELNNLRKIIRLFTRFLLESRGTADFTLWSSAAIRSLNDCTVELKQIKTLSGFDGLEPSRLGKTAPETGADIKRLIDEWEKKGPVTIGDHD